MRERKPADPSTRRQWAVLSEHVLWWLPLAVIVVGAVLLFPYLAREREHTRQQSCQANLKGIALNTLRYVKAHNGRFPAGPDWDRQLDGYVPNHQVLRCPADRTDAPLSYGMNRALYGVKEREIEEPALTVLYHDGRDGVVVQRHSGGANYVFVDGHDQWLQYPPDDLEVTVEEP